MKKGEYRKSFLINNLPPGVVFSKAVRHNAILLVTALLAVMILMNTVCLPVQAAEVSGRAVEAAAFSEFLDTISYREYISAHTDLEYISNSVEIPLPKKTVIEGRNAVVITEGAGEEFVVTVHSSGLYQIEVTYLAMPGRGSILQTQWSIDGDVPFREAQYILLYRIWEDVTAPGEVRDSRGNDLMPKQQEVLEWQTTRLCDNSGIYAEPYSFYLSAGRHVIRVDSLRESLAIAELALRPRVEHDTDADVQALYRKEGRTPAKAELLVYEAENASRKSDTVLYPRNDKSSPLTTPYSTSAIRLNTIGGNSWNAQGQWIEWTIDVPDDGLYRIAFRARQSFLSGSFVTRMITIDGKLPSAEWADIRFQYKNGWRNVVIPYDIFLTKGRHVLRMTATIGALTEVVSSVEQTVIDLNAAYRSIFMITGTFPDPYRDYMLPKNAPEIFPIFEKARQTLVDCNNQLLEIVGRRGSMNGILQTLPVQLDLFCRKPEKVQVQLSHFKDNIGALSAWLTSIKQQSLELDKIFLYPADMPEKKLPPPQANFFQQFLHELRCFLSSYITDYNTVGDYADTERQIEVWVQAGRDQANILKQLIVNDLQLSDGVGVNLKLAPGQLVVAAAAGRGPDVALQVAAADPINFACRGMAHNLAEMPGFPEVATRFRNSVWPTYTLNGGVYALPETQTYQAMFYRSDILAELGIEVPGTWTDLFRDIGRLQKKNMSVGVQPQTVASLAMFLYQEGGSLYLDGNRRSGLSEKEAQKAFDQWMSLYTDYGVPVAYDALNRFRTGEMPIVIEDFTLYNRLMIGAPEIRGMWGFGPVPATVREDGTINESTPGASSACMILADTEEPEAAWEFLKWWTSTDIQARYGREIENLLGPSARYPSANVEAFEKMPWTVAELNQLNATWPNVKGIPEVPGSYFVTRHIANAFRRVVNYGDSPEETLEEYALKVDEEIAAKRKELRLD
jgi:ABC-type glycerol-3-phosphate transport system substrate-binding protein